MKKKELLKLLMLMFAAINIGLVSSCSDDGDMEMENEDPTLAALAGSWTIANEEAALAVGPAVGSADWWFLPGDEVATRSCLLDDVWTFSTDGTLSIDMGGSTWVETWQGNDPEGCASPVAPHNGGNFTFEATTTSITVNGAGAFIGLAKAFNGGELSDGTSSEPASRTYTILEMSETPKRMKLGIPIAGEGNWTFILEQ